MLQAPPYAGRPAGGTIPRPQAYLRYPASGPRRTPQARARAIGSCHHSYDAGYLQPLLALDGRSDREGDGGCATLTLFQIADEHFLRGQQTTASHAICSALRYTACSNNWPCSLRASANRREVDPLVGRARDTRSSGELLKLANAGVYPRARYPVVLHRTHLGAILCLAAGKRSEPSAWLSPLSRTRSSSLREVGSGVGVRVPLLEDRRRIVFGHYFTPSSRRMDCSWGDGCTARTGA